MAYDELEGRIDHEIDAQLVRLGRFEIDSSTELACSSLNSSILMRN
jgi:hypothetical protein